MINKLPNLFPKGQNLARVTNRGELSEKAKNVNTKELILLTPEGIKDFEEYFGTKLNVVLEYLDRLNIDQYLTYDLHSSYFGNFSIINTKFAKDAGVPIQDIIMASPLPIAREMQASEISNKSKKIYEQDGVSVTAIPFKENQRPQSLLRRLNQKFNEGSHLVSLSPDFTLLPCVNEFKNKNDLENYFDQRRYKLYGALGAGYQDIVQEKQLGFSVYKENDKLQLKANHLEPWMTGGYITDKSGQTRLLDIRDIEFKDRSKFLKNLIEEEENNNIKSIHVIGKLIDDKSMNNPSKAHLENIYRGEEACLVFNSDSKELLGAFFTTEEITPLKLHSYANKELFPNQSISLIKLDASIFAKYYLEDCKVSKLNNISALKEPNAIFLVKQKSKIKQSLERKKTNPIEKLKNKAQIKIQELSNPIAFLADDIFQGLTQYLLEFKQESKPIDYLKSLTSGQNFPVKMTPQKFLMKFTKTKYYKNLPTQIKQVIQNQIK
ncbi:MAG: hypothetical protein HRT47_11235 [Candidatus Caenarcaniphilales bacterium]|nr:hypothetical protein [Candidatus Caenarcaniphilales bacterium]